MSKQNETIQNPTEYEVGDQVTFEQPTDDLTAVSGLSRAIEHIKLETKLIAFDLAYRTNYRAIRHDLVRQKRLADFEVSVGLERTE